MEGGDEHRPLTRHDGIVAETREDLHALADPADARSANEHHVDGRGPAIEHHRLAGLERLALTTIGVALHFHVDEAERELPGIVDLAREQDQSGTRPEHRPALGMELLQRGDEPPLVHELEECRTLAAGDDQAVDLRELLGLADLDGVHDHLPACLTARRGSALTATTLLQRLHVEREVTLKGEHAYLHGAISIIEGLGSTRGRA